MRETVVAARADVTGEMSLVAYVVPRLGLHPVTAGDLRQWLMGLVPEYMVPSAFVLRERLPLTPNGKVDRRVLADPTDVRLPASADYVAPRGPIQEALAEIWTDLLGGEKVGVHDNFFERGGHSLMAIQLLARLRQMFGVETYLKDFLEDPTISRLGGMVERALAEEALQQAPPLTRVQRGVSLPASFAQERLWFLDQLEPGRASYNIPAAVLLVGRLEVSALDQRSARSCADMKCCGRHLSPSRESRPGHRRQCRIDLGG